VAIVSGWSIWAAAGQQRPPVASGAAAAVVIDQDDIGGVVTSARGPEAGVWVIAETTDTPTKLRKIIRIDPKTCVAKPTSRRSIPRPVSSATHHGGSISTPTA
jgi:hypothetical protein